MSPATRRKIADVIDQLGYRPNALARGLKASQTKSVAAIVVNMGYPFCVGFLRSLSRMLASQGYHLFVAETDGDAAVERDVIQSMFSQRVDAMVLQSGGDNNDLLASIASQIPVVLVDRAFDVDHVTNMITNNAEASSEMTRHLFDRGYRRVVYVTEPEAAAPTRVERLRGYLEVCTERGIEPMVVRVERNDDGAMADVARNIPSLSIERPFAVYTANGLIMMALYKPLRALELRVPEEMGLATFDEPDWASLVDPSLTCVSQPVDEMGTLAATVVLEQIGGVIDTQDDDAAVSRTARVIPSTLILGGSTM